MQETSQVYFTNPLHPADTDTEFRQVLRLIVGKGEPPIPLSSRGGLVLTRADIADARRVSWDQVK